MPRLSKLPIDDTMPPVWLNWFNSVYQFLNPAPQVYTGLVAPASTPNKIGDIYVDTVLSKCYMATGTTGSSDWKILN